MYKYEFLEKFEAACASQQPSTEQEVNDLFRQQFNYWITEDEYTPTQRHDLWAEYRTMVRACGIGTFLRYNDAALKAFEAEKGSPWLRLK